MATYSLGPAGLSSIIINPSPSVLCNPLPPAGQPGVELCGLHLRCAGPVHLSLRLLPPSTLRTLQNPCQKHKNIHTVPIRHLCSSKGSRSLADLCDRPRALSGGELSSHLLSGGFWEWWWWWWQLDLRRSQIWEVPYTILPHSLHYQEQHCHHQWHCWQWCLVMVHIGSLQCNNNYIIMHVCFK